VYFLQNNLQEAASKFRDALSGDLEPTWVEVWSHLYLGKIFDITSQRERAVNEYRQATRTRDNTQGALEEAEKYLSTPYQRERRSF
jgi:Tfp pilus assembly protein PilF